MKNIRGCAALEDIKDLSAITKTVHEHLAKLEESLLPFVAKNLGLPIIELKFAVVDTVNRKTVTLSFRGRGICFENDPSDYSHMSKKQLS